MTIQSLLENILANPNEVKTKYVVMPMKGDAFRLTTFTNKDELIEFLFDKDIHNWEVEYIAWDDIGNQHKEYEMEIRLSRAA